MTPRDAEMRAARPSGPSSQTPACRTDACWLLLLQASQEAPVASSQEKEYLKKVGAGWRGRGQRRQIRRRELDQTSRPQKGKNERADVI